MNFKSYLWMVIAVTGIIMFGSNLHADPMVHIDDPYGGSFNGGPFKIREQNLETFCIERGETFVPGAAYYYNISPNAQGGGLDHTTPGDNLDPVDARTAWLYLRYLNNPGNYMSMDQKIGLQLAIWRIEDEFGTSFSVYTGYESFAAAIMYANQYVTEANAALINGQIDSNILNNVFALNLYGDEAHTQWRQSQLTVPEPSTLLLLGAGLFGLGLIGRRRKK